MRICNGVDTLGGFPASDPVSMGPRFFNRGRESAPSVCVLGTAWLQWGLGFSTEEGKRETGKQRCQHHASMGPRFFNRGRVIRMVQWTATASRASMGPRFFNRGRSNWIGKSFARRRCFNGASVFQPRKVIGGRWFFEEMIELQWGLGFSTEEGSPRPAPIGSLCAGFNGASVFQPRKALSCLCETFSHSEASMGPRFFNRGREHQVDGGAAVVAGFNGASVFQPRKGSKRSVRQEHKTTRASMGPRFFNRGRKVRQLRQVDLFAVLQWGLGFSTEEGGGKKTIATSRNVGFNGASVFQPRKGDFQEGDRVGLAELQWGLGFSTEEGLRYVDTVDVHHLLQWGLGFSTEEGFRSVVLAKPVGSASMGPRFFNRGRAATERSRTTSNSRFNGASVFQPRKAAGQDSQDTRQTRLQWGLGFSTEEGTVANVLRGEESLASMGPRFFNRGRTVGSLTMESCCLTLQWGLGFSTEEGRMFVRR